MNDPFYIYRPLLDLIGKSEGTDKGRGYNETLAYGAYTGGDRELIAMSLDQIDELQTAMLAHPKNKWNSSAIGRYQIVRTTLRKIRKKLNLSGSETFSATMQDRCACFLLGGRGVDRWLAGKMSDDALLTSLAKEWASLPTPEGKGYYGGQHASVSVSQVLTALYQTSARRAEFEGSAPATPKAKPTGVVPAAGGAVAVGTGAAAIEQSDSYADMAMIFGLGFAFALVVFFAWQHRQKIVATLSKIGRKL